MEGLTDLLGNLAEKLGVTVEYLWPHWIKYIGASAIMGTAIWAFVFMCFAIVNIFFYRAAKRDPEFFKQKNSYECPAMVIVGAVFGAAALLTLGLFLAHGYDLGRWLISPQGYALAELIRKVK